MFRGEEVLVVVAVVRKAKSSLLISLDLCVPLLREAAAAFDDERRG